MGVSSTTNTEIYNGDGTTTSFSFPFYFFFTTDLDVYIYDTVAGTITLQVLGTNYTVSATANSQGVYPNGGSVVFGTAPVSTVMVIISRYPVEQQTFSLIQGGTIPSTALVQQFDYLTLLVQALQDQINRCVQLPPGFGPTFSPYLPQNIGLSANELAYLQVNANANGLALTPSVNAWTLIQIPYTSLSAAALTNVITLFTLPPGAILSGLVLKHSTAFSGPSITDVYAQVGVSASPGEFISDFDIFQSVADGTFSQSNPMFIGSWANNTTIQLKAVATGANLSALTAGVLNVYYQFQMITGSAAA